MRLHATILLIALTLFAAINCKPIDLSEKNWQRMLKGEWMVQFVAPWCTSCKNLAPIWTAYAKTAEKYNVKIATVDITKSPALSGRFLVTSLPTIYHVIDGEFRYYYGKRDNEALTKYIKQKQWQSTEPISAWTNPNSMHMGALSYFFRLSFMLKEWNALLQDEYGLSAYGSYGLFVLGTILIGGILGLVLVVMLDFVSTSKKTKKRRLFKDIKQTGIKNETIAALITTDKMDIDELAEEEEQIIEMNASNADEENSSETEKHDKGKDERVDVGEYDVDDDDIDDDDDDDVLGDVDDVSLNEDDFDDNNETLKNSFKNGANSTFVMSKTIELLPDMYEDESDEDIYHNCKLILPVPTEGPKDFRKPLNATI